MAISLSEYIARLERLAVTRPYFLDDASEKMSVETLKLIDEGFQQRRDPYGNAWAPTHRPNPILEKTADMRHGWSVLGVSSNGFRIANEYDYAKYHQDPKRRAAMRRMIPVATLGLGPIWGPRLKSICADSLRAAVSR